MVSLLMAIAACLSWLVGVGWQTSASALWPMWVYGLVALCAVAGVLALLFTCRALMRRRVHERVGHGQGHVFLLGVLACVAVGMLAWSTTGWRASERMAHGLPADWPSRQIVEVVVQVEGLPQPVPHSALFDARVLRWLPSKAPTPPLDVSTMPAHLSLRMDMPDGQLPRAGQRWQLPVQLHAPDGLSNPAGFDATLSPFERGVRATGKVRSGRQPAQDDAGKPGRRGRRTPEAQAIKLSDEPEYPWQGLIDRTRQRVRTLIFNHVPDARAAGILAGLTVGDQSAITQGDWVLFRETGVAHLVSISGAHIAMFGWMASMLVRWLWSRWPLGVHWRPAPEVAMWAAAFASGLYALLSGWGVPAQRTVWMMLMVAWLRAGGRRWPWPLVWLGSAVLITALDPWAIRQVGFWLSYVAVGVLMSSGIGKAAGTAEDSPAPVPATVPVEPPRRKAEPGPWALTGAALSAIALAAWQAARSQVMALMRLQWLITAALLPLSLVCFQQASIISLAANLIAIPVFTAGITPLSLLGLFWPPFWDGGVWLINAVMQMLAALAEWWPSMAAAPVVPWWVAVPGVVAGFALALPMPWRWRAGLLPFMLPLLHLPQSWHMLPAPMPGHFSVTAADIGQGTAVLVRTARHNLLFDTGPRIGEQLNAGDRTLLPLFHALGVGGLDALMISHEDMDHVGGAEAVLHGMPVASFISSLEASHPLRHETGVDGRPIPHTLCTAGQQWTWDGVVFQVLHPWPEDHAERAQHTSNSMSCVLKVSSTAGGHVASVLLTGDIEAEQEAALVERSAGDLRSTVLIAPHHGSKTSSTPAFLAAVDPAQVVIQAGRRNSYGHPSPTVLSRYEDSGLNWVASPDCGAYIWYSNEAIQPQATSPRVGMCWRPRHHAYWDQPSPASPGR